MDRIARVSHHIAIALGSNLGDRSGHLKSAATALAREVVGLRTSSFLETDAEDVPDVQPPYLNAVAVGETALAPHALLRVLLAIEESAGRVRPGWRAARTLDLDVILYDDLVMDTPDLVIPHPRFRTRRFVLQPLAELAPDWVDPVTGKTVGELLELVR